MRYLVHPPSFFITPPLKIQKVQVPPFLSTLKIFQAPSAESRGGGGLGDGGHYAFFSKNGLILPNFGLTK